MKLTRVRDMRKRKLMTQGELADAAGINRTTLAHVESGKTGPRLSTIRKLADALGVEPLALMGLEERGKRHPPRPALTPSASFADSDAVPAGTRHAGDRHTGATQPPEDPYATGNLMLRAVRLARQLSLTPEELGTIIDQSTMPLPEGVTEASGPALIAARQVARSRSRVDAPDWGRVCQLLERFLQP